MNMIKLFRNYMSEYHTDLVSKDWVIGKRVLSIEDVTEEKDRTNTPPINDHRLVCWQFFYDEEPRNVVYLLQNKHNSKFISIGLYSKGRLIKPISLMEE